MGISVSIKVTIPKDILSTNKIRRAIADAQRRKTGPEIKALFRQTTEGWRQKPTWNQTFVSNSNKVSVTVKTGEDESAQIYALVNAGSPPHIIRPINAGGMLRFKRGYKAATSPRSLVSGTSKRFGGFQKAYIVHHPGFEAREFDKTLAEEYYDTFADDMQKAIADGSRK